jgi:hypothetical protein
MPASLPGSSQTQNEGNPSAGLSVIFNPFSGPKGSPFDAKTIAGGAGSVYTNGVPTYVAAPTNNSTGGLSTGIGFGSPPIIGLTAPASIVAAGFNDDYVPGISYFPVATTMQSATTAILTAIGGGKTTLVNGTGAGGNGTPAGTNYPSTVPYVAQPLLMAGQGGSRDAGAGPAFTGFGTKMVTASATVANGAAVEAGFLNRSGVSIPSGVSVFGSSNTASPAVT